MMQRMTRLVLASVMVLAVVSVAAAQMTPTPVTRMGDWVEIGNEAFMNIIASNTIAYRTTTNWDFENDFQDAVWSDAVTSSTMWQGPCDCMWAEIRLGADFRYQKNLTMRILFEAQSVWDGILIDDRNSSGPELQNQIHVERFWVDYAFPGTPFRMRVGAWLWTHDAAAILGDDDPGIFLFGRFGPNKAFEAKVAAIVQQDSLHSPRLMNDNDNIYYLFTLAYNMAPHRIALDMWYQRDRFASQADRDARRAVGAQGPQKSDVFWLAPNVTGSIGPLTGLFEFVAALGSVNANDGGSNEKLDVAAFSILGSIEANLGVIRPVIGFIWGTGDDDMNDDKLKGFNNMTQRDIGLTSTTRYFNFAPGNLLDREPDPMLQLSGSGRHTVTNVYSDRVGNTSHTCQGRACFLNTTLSNPGVLAIPFGIKLYPVKGHEIKLWGMPVWFSTTEPIEAQLAVPNGSISKYFETEIGVQWIWTISSHFDIRTRGIINIPGAGAKDIAQTVSTCGSLGTSVCEGNDVALTGQITFRGRF